MLTVVTEWSIVGQYGKPLSNIGLSLSSTVQQVNLHWTDLILYGLNRDM
jgi:hypothetical protein